MLTLTRLYSLIQLISKFVRPEEERGVAHLEEEEGGRRMTT